MNRRIGTGRIFNSQTDTTAQSRINTLESQNKTLSAALKTKELAEQTREICKQVHQQIDEYEREKVAAGETPSTMMMAESKANELMEKDSSLTFNDAIAEVFRNDPVLYNRYRKQFSVNA